MRPLVIFTDLDGTLLDHSTYSLRGALPALDLIRRRGLPLVPVSSKTAAEVRRWMKLMALQGPFVYENGCGVIIPMGRFPSGPPGARPVDGEWRLALGIGIGEIRSQLGDIARELGFRYKGFGDMDEEEVARLTGLAGEELRLALEREFDEPFIVQGDHDPGAIRRAAEARGLMFTRGGRFYHLAGGCDKGKAVRILGDMYRAEEPGVLLVGIGDSENDLPMFREVDGAYLVSDPDGGYDPGVPEGEARRVPAPGPLGFKAAVEDVLAVVQGGA